MGSIDGFRRGVVVAVAGCALLPAVAGAAWSGAVDLSAPGQDAFGPQVALDASGNAVTVWNRYDGGTSIVQAASRPTGGNWSSPANLSPPGQHASEQQVALDPKGDAVAVWDRYDGSNFTIQAATRPSGGNWSSPADLSAPGQDAFGPQVALDAKGNGVAVWQRYEGSSTSIVEAATRQTGGNWSGPVALSGPCQRAAAPQVALDAKSKAVVVWDCADGGTAIIQTASRSKRGNWSGPTDLSAPGHDAFEQQVALDAKGDAVAVWQRYEGGYSIVQAATRAKGRKNWSIPANLSAPGQNASEPQVGIDPKGRAVAVWQHYDGSSVIVQAASRPAGGNWSAPTDLSAPAAYFFVPGADPQVALGQKGRAVAVWKRYDGSTFIVQAASRPTGGTWGSPADLSDHDIDPPQVGLDQMGNAVAVWNGYDGTNSIVRASAGP
jgi:hypothetical protein